MMAERMHHCALIRSLTGFDTGHTARPALTGQPQGVTTYGGVVTRLKGDTGDMPPYIHLGGRLFNSPGVGGGVFGAAFVPVMISKSLARPVQFSHIALAPC